MNLTSEIKVKIILDSLINDIRVTTFELRFQKSITPEFLTHRVFSRNSTSSRAIPVERMINEYCNFLPENWRLNQKGMQPAGIITDESTIDDANEVWSKARINAINSAKQLMEFGIAKEQVNRLLEPFMFVKVIVTSTDYQNFFNLRCHTDAQYEIQQLAYKMRDLYNTNKPEKKLFHLPYVRFENNYSIVMLLNMIKCSVARCARVSYNNNNGEEPALQSDLMLYDKLVSARPGHFSPTEHQVLDPDFYHEIRNNGSLKEWPVNTDTLNGNFRQGVVQFRKIIEKIDI